MKLLWIRPTLDSSSGGPVTAITQLTIALRELGHPCEVVTLDTMNNSSVLEFPGIVHALGPSWGTYRFNTRLVGWLIRNADRFDAVIVSGIWQYPSFATWLASKINNIPYFVFTHGALEPWFKNTYPLKHIKKWLYWPWAEYRVLRDAKAVLFTNEEERKSASQSFWLYSATEVVVKYGIDSPHGDPVHQRQIFFEKFPHLNGKRLLLFLGRIHPVKGCDMLIEAFAQISNTYPDLQLVIAGPDQAELRHSLMKLPYKLGIDERITWTGMLTGNLKWGAYLSADVFILPSHSENFGIVVAEALACNLPVLITNKVNIWNAIVEDKAGFVEPDTFVGIVTLLERWLFLSKDERQIMRTNARSCFLKRFEIRFVAEKLIETIEPLVGSNPG